jgi:hypothetical protein
MTEAEFPTTTSTWCTWCTSCTTSTSQIQHLSFILLDASISHTNSNVQCAIFGALNGRNGVMRSLSDYADMQYEGLLLIIQNFWQLKIKRICHIGSANMFAPANGLDLECVRYKGVNGRDGDTER